MGAWFDYVGNIALGVVALLLLFEGCRRLVLSRVRRSSVLMLAGGLVISSAIGGVAYMQYRMSSEAIATLKRPVVSKHLPLPDDWGAACCKDTREEQSRKMVQAAFLETGQIHAYIDASGKRVPYSPSQKDIKDREERAIADARLEDASRTRLSEAVYTLIAALLAMVFGVGLGHQQREASANSTVEPDARKGSARGSP